MPDTTRVASPTRAARRPLAKIASALAVALAALGATSAHTLADQRGHVAIIFDGSGSMWGGVEGDRGNKFSRARDALRETIGAMDATPVLGVFGFGGRRRGRCGAAETFFSFDADDPRDGPLESLDALNPRGRGPLGEAMRTAGARLATVSGPRAMVLIHDDDDNCGDNLCAIAETLRGEMPDLGVHALTLAPSGDATVLACLAEAGGRVVQTLDADDIPTAVETIVSAAFASSVGGAVSAQKDAAGAKVPDVTATGTVGPAGTTQVDGPTGLALYANLAAQGPLFSDDVRWRITPRDAATTGDDDRDAGPWTAIAPAARITLPAGRYRAQARVADITRQQDVTVAEGKTTRTVIDLAAGAITFRARLGADGPAVEGATLTIRRANAAQSEPPLYAGHVPERARLMAVGSYLVTATRGDLSETIRLDVLAGAVQTVTHQLPGGRITVSRPRGGAGGTGVSTPVLVLDRAEDETGQTWREIARSARAKADFHVAPGLYRVRLKSKAGTSQRKVALTLGQAVSLSLSQRTARVALTSELPVTQREAARVHYEITPADTVNAPTRRIFEANPTVALAPGRYTITSIASEPHSRAERTLVVAPDETVRVTLRHEVGRVALNARGVAAQDVDLLPVWKIKDASGATVWRGLGARSAAFLPPGDYLVEARGKGLATRGISITAGRTQQIVLDVE